jgi:hypothetical protein
MPLPSHIRVKLSSEAAGAISLSAVVVRVMPLPELVEEMLAVMGKDRERIRAALERGSFVSGGSRFRWEALEAAEGEVAALLASYPDADPSVPFEPARATSALIQFSRRGLDVSREAGSLRRLFRKRSFWDALMELAARSRPAYVEYSYRRRADVFRVEFDAGVSRELAQAAALLRYPGLRAPLELESARRAEIFVPRANISPQA